MLKLYMLYMLFIAKLVYARCTENEIIIYLKFGERKVLVQVNAATEIADL